MPEPVADPAPQGATPPAVQRARTRGGQARGPEVDGNGSRWSRIGLDRAAWAVGGVAFGLRAVWVLAFARIPSGLSDPFLYHGYAIRIANGRGYQSLVDQPTAYYPPGYPYFLGAVYWVADRVGLSGHRELVVGLVQALLWAVAAMAVVVAGRAAFHTDGDDTTARRAALAGGLVLACWPNLVTYAAAWLSESLFVCLFAVGIAALTLAARPGDRDRSWRWSMAVAAATLAGAAIVRPQVLLGLPLVALAWLLGGLGWRRTLTLAAAVTIAVAALITPWALRNRSTLGETVLVSTNGGDNLCIGFHPGARGSFQFPIEYCDTGEFWNDGVEAELRRNADTRERALDYVTEEPLSVPWLSLRKLWYTYRSDDDGLVGNESYGSAEVLAPPWRGTWLTLAHIAYAGIMVGAVGGLVIGTRRAWRSSPRDAAVLALVGLALVGALVPILFFGDPRFKLPVTPLFALFAGLALAELVSWYDRRGA